jgi:transketolase
VYKPSDPAQASRKLSEIVLTAIAPLIPDLMGGSADLTGSNLTKVKGTVDFQPPSTGLGDYTGTYIRYGVREHGMGAIANGLHAYGGIVPFVATFMVNRAAAFTQGFSLICILELRFVCCWCRQVVSTQQAPGYLGR